MNRASDTFRQISLAFCLAVALPLVAQEKAPPTETPAGLPGRTDDGSRPADAPRPDEAGPGAPATPAAQERQSPQLSDMALARWLSIDQRLEIEISKFAQQRAQNPQVKQFAGRVAQSHTDMLHRLQQLADVVPGAEQAAGQLDETLQDLGENLQDRLQQSGGRVGGILGGRAATNETDAPSAANDDRNSLRERRQAAREQRQADEGERPARPLRDRLADRGEGVNDEAQRPLREQRGERREERQEAVEERLEERREAVDERQASREQRRQELRGLLRENLPEVLDVVGQAIQAEAQQTTNSPWLQFKQQLSQRKLASLKEEFGRYQGTEFDQAYLGHQLLVHLEMIDAFELAQQTASEELRQALADGIVMAQGHLQESRRLMEQVPREAGGR